MIDAAIVRVLLEASLRVCVVALAVAAVLKLARVQSSTVRHAAWASVVVAMLLMPLLPYVLPSFELPGRGGVSATVAALQDDLPYVGDVDLRDSVGANAVALPAAASAIDAAADLPAASRTGGARATAFAWAPMPLWLAAALAIYALGLGMLLVRWLMAARFLARLRRQSTRVATPGPVSVFESALAATPITVGALKPWIVLPSEWRTWSAAKLAGVLAHERAHVDRRDPLFALVAYVNRCIFWFHPLAWWLERKLAATAEDAADDAGVKAMGQEREYAEVLVEMAEVVHRHGGRVAWQGVGVDGNGLLGRRIDRLLSGAVFPEVSRMKKALVAVVVVVAVVVAGACRARVEPAPLTQDPKVAERVASDKAASDGFNEAKALTKEGAEALEAKVRANPEDLDSRVKLLIFYRWSGWKVVGVETTIKRRRAHVLWLVEHKPEDRETGGWGYVTRVGDLADPEGYELVKRQWLSHVAEKMPAAEVIARAVMCLDQGGDLEQAEALALRGAALYPESPRLRSLLAGIYSDALAGALPSVLGAPPMIDPQRRSLTYAAAVRKKLESTTDAALLADVAYSLDRVSRTSKGTDVGLQQVARAYATRAAAIDPASPRVARVTRTFRSQDLWRRMSELRNAAQQYPVKLLDAVLALPAAEQFALLPIVAEDQDMAGESADHYRHDAAAAKASWDVAKRAATSVVSLAPQFRSDASYGPNIFRANCILGLAALRAGDRAKAVSYLTAAADAPPSPEFNSAVPAGRFFYLTNYLLKYGERESVASFYEKYARLLAGDPSHDRMLENAAAIRAGRMPGDYQSFFARVDAAAK